MKNIPKSIKTLILNLLLALILAALTRLIFFLENLSIFTDISLKRLSELMFYGIRFDIAAFIYMNAAYIFMITIPLKIKEQPAYQKTAKWLFVIMNAVFIILNLCDTVYFPFVHKRTTLNIFYEFKDTSNISSIFLKEIVNHWYISLVGILMIFLLYKFYYKSNEEKISGSSKLYYTKEIICFLLVLSGCYIATRSSIGKGRSVIQAEDVKLYAQDTKESSIILNTAFSMIRMTDKNNLVYPSYYQGELKEKLNEVYSPIHYPIEDQGEFKNKNVVILILESFGKEYSAMLNPYVNDVHNEGFTPFLDSLRQESMYFEHTFAHSRKSIDGVPAILSSIPKIDNSFFTSSYTENKYDTILELLHRKGYHTSFFHGAHNGSMGFESFIRNAGGIDEIYQLKEYANMDDYDGIWGIWDEPYLQYFANKLSEFKEPFASALFTLSSHHPFNIPQEYDGKLPEGPHPIFKCIAYSDNALRKFFESARKEPWFNNTVFVLCADHSNAGTEKYYENSIGIMEIQMMFYTPDGSLKGKRNQIAQQLDIMPSLLHYLNYDEPYIAFGNDLLSVPENETWSINDFSNYQFFYKGRAITWDGTSKKASDMYNFIEDPMKTQDILEEESELAETMLLKLKSILAQYKDRMIYNKLTIW